MDGDGASDLLVSVVEEEGDRSLRLYRQNQGGFPQTSSWRMTLPADVTFFTALDVRDEPGLEVVLGARSGLYSVSPTRSVQGNLRPEVRLPLLPDLAAEEEVPRWHLTKDLDGDGHQELMVFSGPDAGARALARGKQQCQGEVRVDDSGALALLRRASHSRRWADRL
jgi:hypothetical protein